MNAKFFLGQSLEDLTGDTKTSLKVFVHELAPLASGSLSNLETLKITVKNLAENATEISSVELKEFIDTEYFGSILNMQRPNVHKNELVLLIALGGDSDMMWIPIGSNPEVRLNEVLRFFVNNKNERTEETSGDTAYVLEVDTRNGQKMFRFYSNKNQGEAFAYQLFIDITNGQVWLQDDVGNLFNLDSELQQWVLKIKEGDQITMWPKNVTVDTVTYTVNATDKVEFNTKDTVFNSSVKFDVHSPSILHDGDTVNTGTLTVNKDITGLKNISATINVVAGALLKGLTLSAGGLSASGGNVAAEGVMTAATFADTTGAGAWHKHV